MGAVDLWVVVSEWLAEGEKEGWEGLEWGGDVSWSPNKP